MKEAPRQEFGELSFSTDQKRYLTHLRRIAPLAIDRGMPQYRFFRFSSDAEENTVRAALIDRRFRFSPPRLFNDPFDSRPHLRLAHPFKWLGRLRYRVATESYVREQFRDDPSKQEQARSELANHSPETLIRQSEDRVRGTLLDSQLMLCLAANRASLQMWAYYADRQRGVCVHLSPTIWPVAAALRITYGSRYPSVPLPFDKNRLVREFSLRKSRAWKHELEYRIIVQSDDPDRFALDWIDRCTAVFPPGAVTGVTVGCMMDGPKKQRISEYASAITPSLPVYQAVAQRNRFELHFEQVG